MSAPKFCGYCGTKLIERESGHTFFCDKTGRKIISIVLVCPRRYFVKKFLWMKTSEIDLDHTKTFPIRQMYEDGMEPVKYVG